MFWFSAQSCRFASKHPYAKLHGLANVYPFSLPPNWSGIGWNGSCITYKGDSIGQRVPLALARVPNIAGREPIEAFTPSYLRMRLAVDIHIEVIAKRKAETLGGEEDVTVATHEGREHRLARPCGAAVSRALVIDVPVRLWSEH